MANDERYDEPDLLVRISEGDQRSFAELVARYTTPIHTHLTLYMKDVKKAEEITQDIFVGLWRNRNRLSGMENFPGYLYIITRNRVKKELKAKILSTNTPPEDRLQKLVADAGVTIETKELMTAIDQGIARLPPKRQQIFRMSRLESMSHEEIADKLQISKNTIKEHIREALVFMRRHLYETLGEVLSLIVFTWLSAL